MPVTVEEIRALEMRRVTLRTPTGNLSGRFAQATIPDAALMVMFSLDAPPGDPVVVAIGDILEVVER